MAYYCAAVDEGVSYPAPFECSPEAEITEVRIEGNVTQDAFGRKVRGPVMVFIRILDRESRHTACTGVVYHANRDGDLPAITETNGDWSARLWYFEGQLHRDGGLPAVMIADGRKAWYVEGKLAREEDPWSQRHLFEQLRVIPVARIS